MANVLPAGVMLMVFCFLHRCECVKITTGPQSAEYTEGSGLAYMFCILDKDPPENALQFWEKGGERITENTKKYTIELQSPQFGLRIKTIERSDEDDYVCGVLSNGNEVKSEPARLTVRQIPSERYPRFEQNSPYKVGTPATVTCLSEDTNPRPKLELFRSGFDSALRTETEYDPDLIKIKYSFTPITEDNNAKFSCKMTSPNLQLDFVRYSNISLNVQFAPIISIKHEQIIEAGKIAILICETTDSNPETTDYEWSEKNGIGFTENFSINGKILRIENPKPYLNGTVLVCAASNIMGRTEQDVTLYVSGQQATSSNRPSTIPGAAKSNNEQKGMDILLKTVIIAGVITISVITLLVLPLCLHHVCTNRHVIDSLGRKISQPQIYFEAHDRVLPTPPDNMDNYTWKRSLAVQVPDDLDIDIELVYQEISEKARSNRNTLAKNTSTYS